MPVPPSNAKPSASSGSGGTRLDQTVSANMSAPWVPAPRFAMMLPTAQAIAAPMTSANPIVVPVRPLATLYAASTTIPATATIAATRLWRWK